MIMLAIKAGRKVWEAAESNEASLSLWRPRGGAPTVPCLSWFTAARIAVVKCTHKSGTFNRVIWQTGARRLPEKSFRLFIRRLEKGCYGRKRRSKRRKRNCSGLLSFFRAPKFSRTIPRIRHRFFFFLSDLYPFQYSETFDTQKKRFLFVTWRENSKFTLSNSLEIKETNGTIILFYLVLWDSEKSSG